jgi:hypothetical protein
MRQDHTESAESIFEEALTLAFGPSPSCIDNLENLPGGVRFMGISRDANPEWPGWFVLDRRHGGPDGDVAWRAVPADLRGLVRSFYRERYWRPVFADVMPAPLAAVVFDSAVVHGRNRALRFLQEALNVMYGFRRLDVDGIFRRDSRHALDVLLARQDWYLQTLVAETLRIRQGCCDLIACGDRRARHLCRDRTLEVQRMAAGCFPGCAQTVPGCGSGLELAC